MRLTTALVERTLGQYDAQPIPDSHPAMPQLKGLFGDHTFFLDGNGLNIVEPADATGEEAQEAKVINLASWTNANPPGLAPHEPEMTDIVIMLGSAH